ncbi:TPA: hypothetical protein N0F65_007992 [Lagenidium giganteum]|uniref:Uncharacterized protein n=1 Tax=Lagenidium giganteum TaxID=4803 RepID=A0AAV2YSX8_9STRA|nr:TPA: hypothetical protein N0F65_007992 [Lagenidium giganteum]
MDRRQAALVYAIFLLIGVGAAMPWNVFLTAESYFQKRLMNTPFEGSFINWFSMAFNLTTLCAMFVRTVCIGKHMANPVTSIFVGLLVIAAILLGHCLLAKMPQYTGDYFFHMTLASIILVATACAAVQDGLLRMALNFPMCYTQAMVAGQVTAGLSISVSNFPVLYFHGQTISRDLTAPTARQRIEQVLALMSEDADLFAFVYFALVFVTLLVCLLAFVALTRLELFHHYHYGNGDITTMNASKAYKSPSTAIQAHAGVEVERLRVVFGGESFAPMMFVRTEHEQLQRECMGQQRIAQQLHLYDSAASTNVAKCIDQKLAPRRCQQLIHLLRHREHVGMINNVLLIRLQETFMPFQKHKHCQVVDMTRDRLYCGGFNSTGDRFLTAGQRSEIRLYDTTDWKQAGELPVHDIRWTVTDAMFSPDDRWVMYSTISNNVRMVDVNHATTGKEEVFTLARRGVQRSGTIGYYQSRFGVWSIDVNSTGTEFVVGTSSNSVLLYDMESKTVACEVQGHEDDVNAIAFVDGPLHSNVFVSGSDDSLIKLWDRRVLSSSNPTPQGVFPGHTDGLTHISSRDDGYYFVSNSKDQSCKLWDLRKCLSSEDHAKAPRFQKPYDWDYRYQAYPGRNQLPIGHPGDRSVMTYRGHTIMETLVRCHFSPLYSTAQKYIYTGSADGRVYVYDVITGDPVEIFAMKPKGLTRDVRWHPFDPTIVSPDFYGKLCVWQRRD